MDKMKITKYKISEKIICGQKWCKTVQDFGWYNMSKINKSVNGASWVNMIQDGLLRQYKRIKDIPKISYMIELVP